MSQSHPHSSSSEPCTSLQHMNSLGDNSYPNHSKPQLLDFFTKQEFVTENGEKYFEAGMEHERNHVRLRAN